MRHSRSLLRSGLLLALAGLVGLLVLPAAALADSISPSTFSATGPTGFSATVHKTVTITAGSPTTSLADVFFLADTTGSMGPSISAVKTAASSILTTTAGLGNVRFGVGDYKDIFDVYTYNMGSNVSAGATAAANQAAALAAIGAWGASGGGDLPEANVRALELTATTAAWRTGSARILVWFGDAPGHDPRAGSTEASATAALLANGVEVHGISVTTGPGLDAACGTGDCTAGQGTRITTATGGTMTSGISGSAVVAAITDAIETAFATYSSVCLATDGGNVPFVDVSFAPDCYTGDFDREIERTFEFDVAFHDLVPGTHTFNIHALVDAGIVATEVDTITSTGGETVPEPASLLLLGAGLVGLAAARRGLRRAK